MEFFIFVLVVLLAFWLIDSFVNQCVQLLLKLSRVFRTLIIITIIIFGFGIATDPVLTAEIIKSLFRGFIIIGKLILASIIEFLQNLFELIQSPIPASI